MVEVTGISEDLLEKARKYTKDFHGTTFHVLLREPKMMGVLRELYSGIDPILSKFFNSKYILHSFSFLDNTEQNFSREIHRDQKFWSGDVPIMCNVIVMLDEFTNENGTRYYDTSKRRVPMMGYRAFTGPPGTVVIFNSNLWHCAGPNPTGKPRRALALTFTKSCIKQLLDYPRALGDIDEPEEIKQLLGYHSRVPASLAEWEGERTYLKDQD